MRISLEILRWSWRRVSWWEFLWKFSGEADEELADENFFANSQGEAEEELADENFFANSQGEAEEELAGQSEANLFAK